MIMLATIAVIFKQSLRTLQNSMMLHVIRIANILQHAWSLSEIHLGDTANFCDHNDDLINNI